MKTQGDTEPKPKVVLVKRGYVTVKIYERVVSGNTYHVVADYSSGTRKFRTFKSPKEARLEAELIATRMSVSDRDVLELRSEDRAAYLRAKSLLASSGVAIESAVSQFVEASKVLEGASLLEAARFFMKKNPGRLPRKTTTELVDEFLSDKEAKGKSSRYLADLEYRSRRFAEKVQGQVSDVTSSQIEHFLTSLNLSTQSYANFRRVIVTLFEFAKRRGYVGRDFSEAQQVEQIAVSNGEITIFTPAELRRLLLAAHHDFLPALAIGAFAGLRSAEVQRLTWEDVNLDEARIEVKKGKSKTSSRRVVPILPALASWLKPYASGNGLVAPFTHAGFYNSQRDTARGTATESEPAVQWKSNALRHSFISFRLAIVEDQNKVALESGNSPAMIHRHYKQLVSAKMAKEWFQLDRESVGRPNVEPV